MPEFARTLKGARRSRATLVCFLETLVICHLLTACDAAALVATNLTECDASCQALQRAGLEAFYDSLAGDYWFDNLLWKDKTVAESRVFAGNPVSPGSVSNYDLSKAIIPLANHCFWYGVTCCSPVYGPDNDPANSSTAVTVNVGLGTQPCAVPGAVVQFYMFPNNLSGEIPAYFLQTIGPTLIILVLTGGNIHGTISPELVNLQSLKYFDLSDNELTGSLPYAFFQLPNLLKFAAIANQLSGTLPRFMHLNNQVMSTFDISKNKFTGPLPIDYLASSALIEFAASSNQLTGSVMSDEASYYLLNTSLSHWQGSALNILYLGSNLLSGNLSFTLGKLQSLQRLDLSNNMITGSLGAIEAVMYIESIRISNNQFSGPLPQFTLGQSTVKELIMSNNRLTGTVPPSYASQLLLETLVVAANSLSGPLPESLGSLPLLSYIATTYSGLHHGSQTNSRGESLPEFLFFDRTLGVYSGVPGYPELQCLSVSGSAPLLAVFISPDYYSFQDCKCTREFELRIAKGAAKGTGLSCVRQTSVSKTLLSAVVVVSVVVITSLLGPGFLLRNQLQDFAERYRKRAGPPTGTGRAYTIFESDVEGSTELWEWNSEVMDKAIDVHDRVMRGLLRQYYGFEVTTEGDAFQFVFHHAADAVAYAIAAQQALLTAKWPPELEQHFRTRTRYTTDTCSGQDAQLGQMQSLNLPDGHNLDAEPRLLSDVMFWGLAVRMVIASGHIEHCQTHAISNRVEYQGEVPKLAHVIGEAPQGGQVLIDAACYAEISNSLADIAKQVASRPDFEALGSFKTRTSGKAKLSRGRSIDPSMNPAKWALSKRGEKVTSEAEHPLATSNTDHDGGELVTADAVAAASLMIKVSTSGRTENDTEDPASDMHARKASMMEGKNSLAATGSSFWTSMFRTTKKEGAFDEEVNTITVMDMGQHCFKDWPGPQKVIQVLVPGLEDRARMFLPLSTFSQISPGYFDAPGASSAPLRLSQLNPTILPDVTLVFCSIEKLKDMKERDADAANSALLIYLACVRKLLRRCGGYECQEAEGSFMLAFQRPVEAVLFCLMVQEEMVNEVWSDETLHLPPCRPLHGPSNEVLFLGPRVKMGIYEGRPTRICPHTTTGRADYFGMLVNRAARYCNATAHGGQIMAPFEVVEKVVAAWTGLPCPSLHSLEGPTVLRQALPDHESEVEVEEPAGPKVEWRVSRTVRHSWSQLGFIPKLAKLNGSGNPARTTADVHIDVDPNLEDTMAKPLELAEAARQSAVKIRSQRTSRASRSTADIPGEGDMSKRRLSGIRNWVKRLSSFQDSSSPEGDTRSTLGSFPATTRNSAVGSSRLSRTSITSFPDGPLPNSAASPDSDESTTNPEADVNAGEGPAGGENATEAASPVAGVEKKEEQQALGLPQLPWNIVVTSLTEAEKGKKKPEVSVVTTAVTTTQQEGSPPLSPEAITATSAEQDSRHLAGSASRTVGNQMEDVPGSEGPGSEGPGWKVYNLNSTLSTVQSQPLSEALSIDNKMLSSTLPKDALKNQYNLCRISIHTDLNPRIDGLPTPRHSTHSTFSHAFTANTGGPLQVEFHHIGTFKLKGVAGVQTAMQINSKTFANRTKFYPDKAASSKAEKVEPGKGLVYTISYLPS